MPQCNKCGIVKSSAEMRHSTTKGEWLCKEKYPCGLRAKAKRKEAR